MLLEADRFEAGERSVDSPWYQIETVDPYEGMSPKEKLEAKARKKIPQQKRPQKLPKQIAQSSEVAIRQTLARYSDGIERCYRRPRQPPSAMDTVIESKIQSEEDTQG